MGRGAVCVELRSCTGGVPVQKWSKFSSQHEYTGWWFGTFFIFPYIGNNHPNGLIFFRGVAQPPTRYIIAYYCIIQIFEGLHIVPLSRYNEHVWINKHWEILANKNFIYYVEWMCLLHWHLGLQPSGSEAVESSLQNEKSGVNMRIKIKDSMLRDFESIRVVKSSCYSSRFLHWQ